MLVMKFGGSSQSTPERIKNMVSLIIQSSRKEPTAVVLSAMGGTTDKLLGLARWAEQGQVNKNKEGVEEIYQKHLKVINTLIKDVKIKEETLEKMNRYFKHLKRVYSGMGMLKEASSRSIAFVSGHGEILECLQVAAILQDQGVKAQFVDARDLIRTDDKFLRGRVELEVTYQNIKKQLTPLLRKKIVPIITGFIASTKEGVMTTLGRGGSDFSAALVGAALKSREIWIWTDVDGVMTADPRKVKNAFSVESMSYEEAVEMSHFGAKVIYPPTMQPALDKKIPLRIKNTFRPDYKGTLISKERQDHGYPITGISSIDRVSILNVSGCSILGNAGTANRVFSSLARKDINIVIITQASSEHTICLALSPENAREAKKLIEKEFELEIKNRSMNRVRVEKDLSVLAIVGANMKRVPGIAGRLFGTLGNNEINVFAIAQGSSEQNISVILSQRDEARALQLVHNAFFNQ